jgi:hypothetical protein
MQHLIGSVWLGEKAAAFRQFCMIRQGVSRKAINSTEFRQIRDAG